MIDHKALADACESVGIRSTKTSWMWPDLGCDGDNALLPAHELLAALEGKLLGDPCVHKGQARIGGRRNVLWTRWNSSKSDLQIIGKVEGPDSDDVDTKAAIAAAGKWKEGT